MKTIGFPRMHKETNEKRDFLPDFFEKLVDYNSEIFLESGYGESLGYKEEDYLRKNPKIKFVDNTDCYSKDMVVVLRCPEIYELDKMSDGSTLVSMLHYPTRSKRVQYLKRRNIFGVSMDAIRNDLMDRIVVDYKGTAGNGMEIAFSELYKNIENHEVTPRPLNVSIIGMGMVGLMAAKAAGKYGTRKNEELFKARGLQPVMVNMLSRNITSDRYIMKKVLTKTDILVDASNRDDATKYIVDNSLLANLPQYAVILDLSVDPYMEDIQPIQVKAIEGIPTGTLDKYVFYPRDKEYSEIPECVSTQNRRTVVGCNAWPGINPKSCMQLYGTQLMPIIKLLTNTDTTEFSENHDNFFIRAIYRSTLEFFEKSL
ncbi:MAG: alanine dehydrogenase-like protein [Clostridia bacterium]|jgi:alanine dehydrogenase|nr:alanine dehydrogenase-like protein [Clostridia bacterium]